MKVVFAGTRQVYGRPDTLPVSESHLVRPTDVNGINKAAGEYHHLVYNNVFGVRACSLRLTNARTATAAQAQPTGLHRLVHPHAVENREIQIYGDGSQLRDFVYVDDAADAFLRAAPPTSATARRSTSAARSRSPARPRRAARRCRGIRPIPPRRMAAREKGHRHRRLLRRLSLIYRTLGWEPRTLLRDGLTRTIEFYRAHLHHYVTDASPVAAL